MARGYLSTGDPGLVSAGHTGYDAQMHGLGALRGASWWDGADRLSPPSEPGSSGNVPPSEGALTLLSAQHFLVPFVSWLLFVPFRSLSPAAFLTPRI